MRPADRQAFLHAAAINSCCIVVREGFSEGLAKAGQGDIKPRPQGVDLPVAESDQGKYQVAGLVVDPTAHPGVFRQRRRRAKDDALKRLIRSQGAEDAASLTKLNAKGRTPWAVDVNAKSPRFGAVMHDGKYLHDVHEIVTVVPVSGPPGGSVLLSSLVVQALGPARAHLQGLGADNTAEELAAFLGAGQSGTELALSGLREMQELLQMLAQGTSKFAQALSGWASGRVSLSPARLADLRRQVASAGGGR